MPKLDWDVIDRAVGIMEQHGMQNVRASKHGPHTATIDFDHPTPLPWLTNEPVFGSSIEVNTAERVVNYTLRFPAINDRVDTPERDAISVALTAAADELPPGWTTDVVGRQTRRAGSVFAPHIRGDPTEKVPVVQFARQVGGAQETFFDRL